MILVEYACHECGSRQETWTRQPIAPTVSCVVCGGPARRRFGGALIGSARADAAPPPSSDQHAHGVPGSCVLAPTAARMLEARVRGDRRAIERETAYQEQAISAGRLDPHRPPVVAYPGQPGPGEHGGR